MKIALALRRHLFPHGDRVEMLAQGFWIYLSTLPPISNIFSYLSSSALKRHLTLSNTEKHILDSRTRSR